MLFGERGRVDAVAKALPGWLIRLRPLRGLSTPVRYGITTALVLAIFAIRWWLDPHFANIAPFLLFLPVVAAAGRPAVRPWHQHLRGDSGHRARSVLFRRASLQLRHPG